MWPRGRVDKSATRAQDDTPSSPPPVPQRLQSVLNQALSISPLALIRQTTSLTSRRMTVEKTTAIRQAVRILDVGSGVGVVPILAAR